MVRASTAGRRFLQVAFEGNTKPRRARSLYQLTTASRGSKHFKHSHRYLHRHAPHVKGGRCSLLLTEGDLSRTKLRSPPDTAQIIAHHVRSAAAAASLLVHTSNKGHKHDSRERTRSPGSPVNLTVQHSDRQTRQPPSICRDFSICW